MKFIRDRWPSNTLFIFAAVGSAVGLGNVWRFPYLVGKYGGGAFLLPYFVILFLVGYPLMLMEFGLGQKMQLGAVGALRRIHHTFGSIGLGVLMSAFAVCSYYAVIMGWCILYTLFSFTLAWGDDTKTFFYDSVLNLSGNVGQIEGIVLPSVIALAVSWVMVYFAIWRGVKSLSHVVTVTMPLPIILMLILLVKVVTLEGAWEGVSYLFRPDLSAFFDPEIWMAASTQIFFTLSLGFGVMIAYASYRDKNSDIVKSALITSISDGLIAILAGVTVFATIGYMTHQSGKPLEELASSGPSLGFVVFPKALSLIPGAVFFAVIFFVMLITLAVDSLFSLVESIATFFEDSFPRASKKMIVFFICLVCFICGLVFTTTAGIYYLDITDHFITQYGLVLMGLLQTVAVGWFYGPEKMRSYINEVSTIKVGRWWCVMIKYVIPILLFAILLRTLYHDIAVPYNGYPQWAIWSFGWGLVALMLIIMGGYAIFQHRNNRHRAEE